MNSRAPRFEDIPVFKLCRESADCIELFGVSPMRIYLDRAPQEVEMPYAVYRPIFGIPEHYLGCPPDIDTFTVQIDVYHKTLKLCREAVAAIIGAIECATNDYTWGIQQEDPQTRKSRVSVDADFIVCR